MKDKQLYQIHAEVCQTLTNPIRLQIIDQLRDGEKSVTQMVEAMDAPQGTVSRHLSVMRAKGVVVPRREGSSVYYSLGSPRILAAYDEMHQFAMEYLLAQSELLTPV
ncbi:MAG: winged helix-turn-helix transcriptional regulator [Chloroflexi bacterium]|nr:winged helix-turn-helix transcriptional regulator [Chloroflexota bacterium]